MSRHAEQLRIEAAWHEAGHAVALHLAGRRLERVELRADGSGCVVLDSHLGDVADAIGTIVCCLAGEAAFRAAWAMGRLSDAEVGGTRRDDVTPEHALSVPIGSSPEEAMIWSGWYQRDSSSDERAATHIAEAFSRSFVEADALMHYGRARAAGECSTPMFLTMAGALAAQLLERSPINYDDATAIMEVAAELAELESDLASMKG